MKPEVVILDYGVGNLRSVTRAFEHCGAAVTVSGAAEAVATASRLVVPGVGAFGDCMAELKSRHLLEPIREFARSGRPFLGICVGMQMLFEIGEEFGRHQGLGILSGVVQAIPATASDGSPHKVPHIGWNGLLPAREETQWHDSILAGIKAGEAVYFVHSFAAEPADPACELAVCLYNGRRIVAAARSGNLYGCQFHPEKSGETGLAIIRNFLALPATGKTGEKV